MRFRMIQYLDSILVPTHRLFDIYASEYTWNNIQEQRCLCQISIWMVNVTRVEYNTVLYWRV